MYNNCTTNNQRPGPTDFGPYPFAVNIKEATLKNTNFRTALWSGCHLQVTLMCIPQRQDIGVECHKDVDQFICIEQGEAMVVMGDQKDRSVFKEKLCPNDACMIPAGKWHNVINIGNCPLKLFSVYGPPNHPHGTVQRVNEEEHPNRDCKCN